MRRTKWPEIYKMHFQELWDSCAQNEKSEIIKQSDFQEFWDSCAQNQKRRKYRALHVQKCSDSCAQNKKSEISKNAWLGRVGLLFAERNVRNLKKCTFKIYGTPVRRTNRRKSQKMDFQEFWDSCAQNQTSEISKG